MDQTAVSTILPPPEKGLDTQIAELKKEEESEGFLPSRRLKMIEMEVQGAVQKGADRTTSETRTYERNIKEIESYERYKRPSNESSIVDELQAALYLIKRGIENPLLTQVGDFFVHTLGEADIPNIPKENLLEILENLLKMRELYDGNQERIQVMLGITAKCFDEGILSSSEA